MSKTTTVYNKSDRNFVLSSDLKIKARKHAEIPSELAETLVKKYAGELTLVNSVKNEAENLKIDEAKKALAEDIKKFEEAQLAFEQEKEDFFKEKEAFEKAKKADKNGK